GRERDRHSCCIGSASDRAGKRPGDLEPPAGTGGVLAALPVAARAHPGAGRPPPLCAALGAATDRAPALGEAGGVPRELPPRRLRPVCSPPAESYPRQRYSLVIKASA